MNGLGSNLDLELLQAKWVLGGIEPEELVELAVSALQHGFGGIALEQLAGLSQPISRDLGSLPDRAFTDMGLKSIDQNEAISILLDRGEPSTDPAVSKLREAFPDFSARWKEHVAWWGGKS